MYILFWEEPKRTHKIQCSGCDCVKGILICVVHEVIREHDRERVGETNE